MAAQLPKTQRKWICEKLGAENLVLHTDAPVALPESPYDIVVRIYAAALNPVDWKMCDWGAPRGIGIDGTGLVVAVGSSVDTTQFRLGESIIYFHAPLFNLLNGAVAEYCLMDSRYAAIVPESLLSARGAPGSAERQHLYEELASLPTAAFTAHQLVISKLHFDIFGERNSYQGAHANIINVRYVLVTAGAGGVGGFCLQLLRLWLQNSLDAAEREKVKIIATSSKNNFDYVKQLGATHTIDYNSENLEERIKELTDGNGIDVWIDLVGKSSVEQALRSVNFGGHIALAVENAVYENNFIFAKALSIHNVALGWAYQQTDERKKLELRDIARFWLNLLEKGLVSSQVQTCKLEEAKEGLLQLKSGHTKGKIVISIP